MGAVLQEQSMSESEKVSAALDMFAAAALQGLLHSYPGCVDDCDTRTKMAEDCYMMAMAMMAARRDRQRP